MPTLEAMAELLVPICAEKDSHESVASGNQKSAQVPVVKEAQKDPDVATNAATTDASQSAGGGEYPPKSSAPKEAQKSASVAKHVHIEGVEDFKKWADALASERDAVLHRVGVRALANLLQWGRGMIDWCMESCYGRDARVARAHLTAITPALIAAKVFLILF